MHLHQRFFNEFYSEYDMMVSEVQIMIYLKKFIFPTEDEELTYIFNIRRTCYNTFYPFKTLSRNALSDVDFEPITIFYGGNGSGKTTALNIIAEKLKLKRGSVFNQSSFYQDYLKMCESIVIEPIPNGSQIITSDDVFDYMIDVRVLNQGIDNKREGLFDEYLQKKNTEYRFESLDDYERLKERNNALRTTQSQYTRERLIENVRTFSNGENAYKFFMDKIIEDQLVLLDEPENSLSPKKQLELVEFIETAARYLGCQFIIATHSPFILSLKYAKVYDFDANPVMVKDWKELENIKIYKDFFQKIT